MAIPIQTQFFQNTQALGTKQISPKNLQYNNDSEKYQYRWNCLAHGSQILKHAELRCAKKKSDFWRWLCEDLGGGGGGA